MILSESFELGQFVQAIQRIHETHTAWYKKTVDGRRQLLERLLLALTDEIALESYLLSTSKMQHKSFISRRVSELKDLFSELRSETTRVPWICGTILDFDSQIEQFLLGVVAPLLNGQAVICAWPENCALQELLKNVISDLSESVPLHIYCYEQQNLDAVEWIIQHPSVKSLYVSQTSARIKQWAYSKMDSKEVALLGESRHVSIVLEVPPDDSSFYESLWNQESQRFRNTRLFALDSVYDALLARIEGTHNSYAFVEQQPVQSGLYQQYMNETSGRKINLSSGALTLLSDFSNCSPLHQQMNDAPVVTLTRAKYAHEAVKFANTTSLGWTASVWGETERAQKIAMGLDYDWVFLNAAAQFTPKLQFGHAKLSHRGLTGRTVYNVHNFRTQVIA